jgi:hypothetical protein
MSEWPKRYDQEWCHNGPNSFDMIVRREGEYVTFEDFEELLLYTVEVVRRSPRFDWVNASDLKEAVLRDIETWKKRKDTPGV